MLEPHVPVHRVSVRPGAAGERAAARAARPVDVRVRRRHGSPHGRTGAGITGKGPELFAAAPAALPVTSRRTPRGVARGAYPDRRRRGVPRPSRTAGAWSPFTTAARTAGRPVHPGSPRQQHRRRYCRTALPGYTTSTHRPDAPHRVSGVLGNGNFMFRDPFPGGRRREVHPGGPLERPVRGAYRVRIAENFPASPRRTPGSSPRGDPRPCRGPFRAMLRPERPPPGECRAATCSTEPVGGGPYRRWRP